MTDNILDILSDTDLAKLNKTQLIELDQAVAELNRRENTRKIDKFYPPHGPLSRENYKKHIDYFNAGAFFMERCALSGNRTGKTEGIGAYEMTLHMTGEYPDWWEGRRFDHAVRVWMAGDTGKTVRDIIQRKMLGQFGDFGTGMIPGELIMGWSPKYGLPEAVELVKVKHVSGGVSEGTFKSYDQGRKSFQGTELHVGWCDEEPPLDVYSEMIMRLMTTGGIMLCTFTPLEGMTEVVRSFMPGGSEESDNLVVN